ncbi:MAG: hypothetical protein SVW57_10060, partial [Thermodesulfobacteriota bacterium]|nr:hypothetical protein [Thermodesulfobacteriota bacterium]
MKQSNKLKIGELLVHEGYITKDQLQEILSFQKKQKVYKPLGEICVELQFLSKNTLNKLLNTHKKRIQLGDLLINLGLITEGQLETALKHQKSRGGKLGETLLRLGFITENSLINTLTIQMGVPKIVPDFRLIERDLLEGISKEFLIKNEVLPAFKAEGVLTVIMSNPLDEEIIRDLKHIFRCSIEPAIAPAQDIVSTLEHYYQS